MEKGQRKDDWSRYAYQKKENTKQVYQQNRRSFVEVVKDDGLRSLRTEGGQGGKSISMTWSGDLEVDTEDWISRSAFGKLREFASVEMVNKNLEDRGIVYSAAYMGGKYVVWTFESSFDRDGFINNGFLWRKCFSTMSEGRATWNNCSKLIWVDIYGVPLSCWCKSFFYKLGNMIGEMMWIEKDTFSKSRLDRGRILVLISPEKSIPSEVQLKIRNEVVMTKLEIPNIPVSGDWLVQSLGLKCSKFREEQEEEHEEFKVANGQGEWGLVKRCQEKSEGTEEKIKKNHIRVREKAVKRRIMEQDTRRSEKHFEKRKVVSDKASLPKSWFLNCKTAGKDGHTEEKGKGKWCRKVRKPTRIPNPKGGITIGAAVDSDLYFPSSTDGSSVSEYETAGGGFYSRGVGECSKGVGPLSPVDYGPREDNIRKVMQMSKGHKMVGLQAGPGVEVLDNIFNESSDGPTSVSSPTYDSSHSILKTRQVVKSVDCNGRESLRGLDLCIDLRDQGSDKNSLTTGESISQSKEIPSQETVVPETQLGIKESVPVAATKKAKGKSFELLTRSHPMKTRCSVQRPISGLKKVVHSAGWQVD
ncbi:hypothetical protein Q3G72_017703 [Acer saccharum]|nr:hypothetical protein Q3G72_017703 [Acer saccharum]